jgi:cytidylate kinase
MDTIIITVGRQFGSGGGEIAKKLAKELNISYYDKELLAVAAKDSGLCSEMFEKADEQGSDSLIYAFSTGFAHLGLCVPYNDALSNERLFQLQSDAIRKLAENESCVIIGRCSDYILRDMPNCLSFFIHGNLENRIERIVKRMNISETQAKELIAKTDKSRAAYYNYYTDKSWGVASSYDCSIDASVLGTDDTVMFLKDFIRRRNAKLSFNM